MTLGISLLENISLLHTKIETHDTYHWYVQQYSPPANYNTKLSPRVSQCAILNELNIIMLMLFSLTYVDV